MNGPYRGAAGAGLIPAQQTSDDARLDLARGLAPVRGPSRALPPEIYPVGPYWRAEESNFGKSVDIGLDSQATLLQLPGFTSRQTPTVSVIVGYTIPTDTSANTVAFPVARVTAGAGGASIQFDMDVPIGGACFNIPASTIEIAVFHPTMPVDVTLGVPGAPIIRAHAFLGVTGSMSRPGTSNPARRTIFVTSLAANGGTAFVPIPRLATSFQVGVRGTPSASLLANLQISQSASPTNNVPTNQNFGINAPNAVAGAIPLASGAQSLVITNNDPNSAQSPTIIFYLSI